MSIAPRIALWGAFDVPTTGHLLTPRVVEAELRRRLPDAVISTLAPLGALRPLALDGGRTARPLVEASDAAPDCVLVCGDDALAGEERAAALWGDGRAASPMVDGLGEELEAACPVVWAGVGVGDPDPGLARRVAAAAARRGPVAVTGAAARERLATMAPGVAVEELPPWALLVPRLLDAAVLDARAELMRMLEWAWPSGPVLLVHGDRSLLPGVGDIAATLLPLARGGAVAVQLAVPGGLDGEAEFAAGLEAALGGRCRVLRPEAQLEDLVAVLRGSAAVAGPDGALDSIARALSVPSGGPGLLRDPAGLRRLLDPSAPGPDRPSAEVARLDAYLDRLARLALTAAAGRAELPCGEAAATLARAREALGRRIVAERRAFEAELDGTRTGLEAELGEAREEAARLRSELAAARAANDAITGSRTWRYSQPARDTLARVRERRR